MTDTTPPAAFRIGLLLFPDLTQLDMTGPYEVFARMPGAEVHLVWKTMDPVRTEHGLTFTPTATFASCPPLDLLCVPGGLGVNALLGDAETLAFVRRAAAGASYVTSVCTGSLLLGAAGLLVGRKSACHWLSRDLLKEFGAEPVAERVVVDGRFISGGGVTAGIDFALRVVAEVAGREIAETIQLIIEYDPKPPFDSGSPLRARPELVAEFRRRAAVRQDERIALVRKAAAVMPAGGAPGSD